MSFPGQGLQRAWYMVDASNQTVGRLAGQIAQILKGKHKPTFQPNKDMGDFVIVINAEKVRLHLCLVAKKMETRNLTPKHCSSLCSLLPVFFVIAQVQFSSDKWKSKLYQWHTGYSGGLKQRCAEEMLEWRPEQVLKKAVLGSIDRTSSSISSPTYGTVSPIHRRDSEGPTSKIWRLSFWIEALHLPTWKDR
jgi:large subunit ribosomal protein L13